jgi:hypothetical protein
LAPVGVDVSPPGGEFPVDGVDVLDPADEALLRHAG